MCVCTCVHVHAPVYWGEKREGTNDKRDKMVIGETDERVHRSFSFGVCNFEFEIISL